MARIAGIDLPRTFFLKFPVIRVYDGSMDNSNDPIPVINVDNNVIEDASNG